MSATNVCINGLRRNGLNNPSCTRLHTHLYIPYKHAYYVEHNTGSILIQVVPLHVRHMFRLPLRYIHTYMHPHHDSRHVTALGGLIFFFKETPTGALYYSNLVIYTNKPFVSNLICYRLNYKVLII